MKQEIQITTKDREVVARLYEDGKFVCKAHAKCHPEDTFDLCEGSRIAVERLKEKYTAIKSRTKYDKFADGEFCVYCRTRREAMEFVNHMGTHGFHIDEYFYKETYLADSVTFRCSKGVLFVRNLTWHKGYNYSAVKCIRDYDAFKKMS